MVQLPGQNAGPLPTWAPGLGLVALSQDSPAHRLLSPDCRQHSGPTPGQGSDTAYTQPVSPGAAVFPSGPALSPPLSPRDERGTNGPQHRSHKYLVRSRLFLHHL